MSDNIRLPFLVIGGAFDNQAFWTWSDGSGNPIKETLEFYKQPSFKDVEDMPRSTRRLDLLKDYYYLQRLQNQRKTIYFYCNESDISDWTQDKLDIAGQRIKRFNDKHQVEKVLVFR